MPPHSLKTYKSGSDVVTYCKICGLEWPECVGECCGKIVDKEDAKAVKEKIE